jgi:hypothetical protein
MKKIIFFFSIFLIFACEDKEDEVNPLVGQWNMTNFSGGVYLKLNKTQEIFMGETEGSIEAKTISNEILTDTYNLTEVRIDNNDDGTFIDVSEYANNYSVDYNIRDFIGSLDAYDESSLYIYSNNINGDYYGTNFDYTISTNSLKVFPDTLYRKLYINGNEVWDSTRYAVVEGSITQLTTLVEAGQDFLMDGDEFEEILGPSELTLILNDDSTGRAIESFDGDTEENEIKWQATDSTFSWNYCYDGDCTDEGPEFSYEISGTSLSLSIYQDMCEYFDEYCDEIMNGEYGVEMGTLEAFWMEMNVSLSSTQASKKAVNKIYYNKRSKWGNYSFINGYKPPKKFNR